VGASEETVQVVGACLYIGVIGGHATRANGDGATRANDDGASTVIVIAE
jgi:hypothetical protein